MTVWSSGYWLSAELYVEAEDHTVSIFRAEEGGNIFLRNVGIFPQVHTTLQPRRPTSINS
jgi:hypothetical protein